MLIESGLVLRPMTYLGRAKRTVVDLNRIWRNGRSRNCEEDMTTMNERTSELRRRRRGRSEAFVETDEYREIETTGERLNELLEMEDVGSARDFVKIGMHPDREFLVETSEEFTWTKQWYPVAVADMIDKEKPHKVELLGTSLVVWFDSKNETWNVFEDKCPHRLAPLSEGRVEKDGTLLCAYHAWRFDGDGNCTQMPQASNQREEERIKKNKLSCAIARPTMEKQGLIWCWGESSSTNSSRTTEQIKLEASMTPAPLIPEMEGVTKSGVAPGGAYRNHWQMRDLPYGWCAFFENAIDPAHAVVSHHTLVGDRYKDPAGFACVVERPTTDNAGFRCAMDPAVPPFNSIGQYDGEASYDFQPPCLLKIDWRHDECRFLTSHYCVPTKPGWCRHIVATVCQRNEFKEGNKVRLHRWFKLNLFTLTSPAWMTHVLGPTFLHQDMVLLHQQEKIIMKKHMEESPDAGMGEKWKDQVFIPTGADKMTVMFYKWFRKNGPIPWKPGNDKMPEIERDESKLFDTWEMHTKYCTHCKGAMRNTEYLVNASLLVSCLYVLFILVDLDYAAVVVANGNGGADFSILNVLRNVPNDIYGHLFSLFSFLATAYSLDAFKSLFKTYKFSHSEDDIMAEGTAKIGLANDGPSLYIDLVDNLLFGFGKDLKSEKHSRGCECSTCDTKNFEGVRSVVMANRVRKRMAAVENEENKPWERR